MKKLVITYNEVPVNTNALDRHLNKVIDKILKDDLILE